MTAEEKAIGAMNEFADERIAEVTGLYRARAEMLVKQANKFRRWAEEDSTGEDSRRELRARAYGIEEALEGLGFTIGYNAETRESYLREEVTA